MVVKLEKGSEKRKCKNCLYYDEGYCKLHKIEGKGNGIKTHTYLSVNPNWLCFSFVNKEEYQRIEETAYITVLEKMIAEVTEGLLESHTIYKLARQIFTIFRSKLLG